MCKTFLAGLFFIFAATTVIISKSKYFEGQCGANSSCSFQSSIYLLYICFVCSRGLLLDSWVSRGVNMMWPVKQNNKKFRPSPPPRLSMETISGLFSLGVFSICYCSLWDMKVAMCFDLSCSRQLFFSHHECQISWRPQCDRQRDPQIRPVTKKLPSKMKHVPLFDGLKDTSWSRFCPPSSWYIYMQINDDDENTPTKVTSGALWLNVLPCMISAPSTYFDQRCNSTDIIHNALL